MSKFYVPAKFYIHPDQYGRMSAWTKNEIFEEVLAEITVNRHDGVLAGSDPDMYLASLRKKAVRAYDNGAMEING